MEQINILLGKKVLFIDLETTGFPKFGGDMPGGYHDYTENSSYDTSRIIQFGWYYNDKFSLDIKYDNVKSILRKPWDFKEVPEDAIKVHGLTFDKISAEGTLIKKIFKEEFGKNLLECDYIVGYNAYFDFSVLANEIYRAENIALYAKIMKLKDKNIICMMEIARTFCGKKQKQTEVYKELFGKYPENQHDAKGDVIAMLKILKYISENPIKFKKEHEPKKSQQGCAWSTEDENKLKELYESNTPINELTDIFGRTDRGIRHRIKRLGLGKKISKNISKNTDSDKPINIGKPWTDKLNEKLNQMYINENKSIKDIALEFKRTEGSIKSQLEKFEILKEEDINYKLFCITVCCSPNKKINGKLWNSYTHDEQLAIFDSNNTECLSNYESINLQDSTDSFDIYGQKCYKAVFKSSIYKINLYKEFMIDKYCDKNDDIITVKEINDMSEWIEYKNDNIEHKNKQVEYNKEKKTEVKKENIVKDIESSDSYDISSVDESIVNDGICIKYPFGTLIGFNKKENDTKIVISDNESVKSVKKDVIVKSEKVKIVKKNADIKVVKKVIIENNSDTDDKKIIPKKKMF
jgi:hypothetical protein